MKNKCYFVTPKSVLYYLTITDMYCMSYFCKQETDLLFNHITATYEYYIC